MVDRFIIYKVTCHTTGRSYIGVTVRSLKTRWTEHVARGVRGVETPLGRAIAKYGKDDFEVYHIASAVDSNNMIEAERALIVQEGTCVPLGYNLTSGGDGLFYFPDEVRKRMSDKGRGRPKSEEWKRRMSAKSALSPGAVAHREKLAQHRRGTFHSIETREKMRAAWLRRKANGVTGRGHRYLRGGS